MRSKRATGPATSEAGAARAWCRYRDNLARHLLGVSRHLQMRRLGNRPGSGDAALLAKLLEPTRMGT